METPLTCKKGEISSCQKKPKMESLRKLFEQNFYRGVLVYLRYQSIPCIITKYCMGCTIQDLSQMYHDCITSLSIEWK